MDVEESSSSSGCVDERRRVGAGVALGCGTDRAAAMEVGTNTKARAAGASTSAVPKAKRAGRFGGMVAMNAGIDR